MVKVHTHQLDVMSVHQDRGSDGTFVDVLSVDDSLPPPFVQHNSDSVFVVEFSSSHEKCVYDVSPIFQLVHVSTFRSIELRPICSLRARSPFLRFFSLECIDLMFFFEEQ